MEISPTAGIGTKRHCICRLNLKELRTPIKGLSNLDARLNLPSRPGEFHPGQLTDPYMSLWLRGPPWFQRLKAFRWWRTTPPRRCPYAGHTQDVVQKFCGYEPRLRTRRWRVNLQVCPRSAPLSLTPACLFSARATQRAGLGAPTGQDKVRKLEARERRTASTVRAA